MQAIIQQLDIVKGYRFLAGTLLFEMLLFIIFAGVRRLIDAAHSRRAAAEQALPNCDDE
jgi:hypothetical protein